MQTSIKMTAILRFSSCSSACRCRAGFDQVLAQLLKDRLVAQQLGGLVIDEEDVDLFFVGHDCSLPLLPMQPHSQGRQELLGVDRLCEIIGGAGFQTLLTVAFHRFGGQRNDRQPPESRVGADHLHRLIAVHFGHHDVHQNDS